MLSICKNKSYKIFSGKKKIKITKTDNLQICENVQHTVINLLPLSSELPFSTCSAVMDWIVFTFLVRD